MDYFRELDAWLEWITDHRLSQGARNLWQYLLYRCSRCAYLAANGDWLWRVQFFVRPEQLEQVLGNTYRNIARHRRELEDAGLIRYQKAVKGKSQGLYTLIPFADNVAPAVRTTVSGQSLEVYVLVNRAVENSC